jgi:predicted CoA-binding protein
MNKQGNGFQNPDDARIRQILGSMRRIAVVGISNKEDRASHGIAKFLISHDFEVYGVNPTLKEVLGRPVYANLAEVPGPIDVVDVFRRSEAVPAIADEAIAVGAKILWLQEGVVHEEAALRARDAGLEVVMDRCIYQEWLRLMNA